MPATTLLRSAVFVLLFGLYLTLRGYHSFEGDQAYRFPILKHTQDFRLFEADPFVRSFDQFNPHRGYLAVLDALSRPWGLAAAVAVLYGLTYALTAAGLDRLARSVWPQANAGIGVVTVGLVLSAQAGNIGTNHLFEPILYERLIGFGLGWVAIAALVADPGRGGLVAALAIGLAGFIHPSIGLQLALSLGAGCMIWGVLGLTGEPRRTTVVGVGLLLLVSALPGAWFNLRHSEALTAGLSTERIRLLSAELQSPQHMLPHLWRRPQWEAWACYPLLAVVALVAARRELGAPAKRLAALLAVLLMALGVAWLAIEPFGSLRVTLFQPFRMATVARGLCLVLIAGHVVRLWQRGTRVDTLRCVLIAVGLIGDRLWVVIVLSETTMTCADVMREARPKLARIAFMLDFVLLAGGAAFLSRHDTESGHVLLLAALVGALVDMFQETRPRLARSAVVSGFVLLAAGAVFIARHDAESGHVVLLAALAGALVLGLLVRQIVTRWDGPRLAWRLALAWTVPGLALAANLVSDEGIPAKARPLRQSLVKHCRFREVPIDDVERLAVWCRKHTSADAVFVGPPGPKTFRLWSERSLAFNRAGSPYAAVGLADWAGRFADHVGLAGQPEELVSAYLRDRKGLERQFDEWNARELAALARRQGAAFILARRGVRLDPDSGLILLRNDGKHAIYRVDSTRPTNTRPVQTVAAGASAGTG